MIALAKETQSNTGKSNEWYTPAKYIEAARSVMGAIDLDPASCEVANQTVKATRYYSKEDDGLTKPWYGSVWLNPPYGRLGSLNGGSKSWQILFTQKLEREYRAGHIEQAILLTVGLSCLNGWFEPFWNYPLCFQKKITFKRPNGTYSEFGFGSIFIYLGPNEHAFIEHFSAFGRIARAIDTPKTVSKPRELWEVL